MPDLLAYFNVTVVVVIAAFVAGVVFSQRIKDWAHGVPKELRKGLNEIETKLTQHVKSATTHIVTDVVRTAPGAMPPPAPPGPSG